jgi:hypothetical protein
VDWEVGDGAVIPAPLYYGTVEIIGLAARPAAISILGEEFILGTEIMKHYKVTFDHGHQVIVGP